MLITSMKIRLLIYRMFCKYLKQIGLLFSVAMGPRGYWPHSQNQAWQCVSGDLAQHLGKISNNFLVTQTVVTSRSKSHDICLLSSQ